MPFGFPVVPEVYRMNSGFSASKPSRLVVEVGVGHRVVPPDVAALGPLHLVAAALHDEHVLRRSLRRRARASTVALSGNTLPLR